MLSLNRYRLKHLKRAKNKGAIKASKLLEKTDQLISVILIGNNFVNILASSIATVVAIRIWGDAGIAIATAGLTVIILIFAEITPKTIAAYHPERIAFPASHILALLLKILYPIVWMINLVTNGLLKLAGIQTNNEANQSLSKEELRTIVNEAGSHIPQNHQEMLVSILDLEKATVNDIMIPRNEIFGINIDEPLENIFEQVRTAPYTRIPVYKNDINQIIGILHMRNVTKILLLEKPTKSALLEACREPYFVPESTPLTTQLMQFKSAKRRIGVVVDEYGDVQGLATMEDILEEIVGDFTTDHAASTETDIVATDQESFLIDGGTTLRFINKSLDWDLPTDGPKTLSGLITDTLETIPDAKMCLKIATYRIEIRQIKDNTIKTAEIFKPENGTPSQVD